MYIHVHTHTHTHTLQAAHTHTQSWMCTVASFSLPVGPSVIENAGPICVHTHLRFSKREIDSGAEYTIHWKCFMFTLSTFPKSLLCVLLLRTLCARYYIPYVYTCLVNLTQACEGCMDMHSTAQKEVTTILLLFIQWHLDTDLCSQFFKSTGNRI